MSSILLKYGAKNLWLSMNLETLKNALTALLKHNTISVLLIPSWYWLPSYYGSQSSGTKSFYGDAVSEKLRLFGFDTLFFCRKRGQRAARNPVLGTSFCQFLLQL